MNSRTSVTMKSWLILLAFLFVFLFGRANAKAMTVLPTDVTTPKSGNVLIQVKGSYEKPNVDQILKELNRIRWEACTEGITVNDKKLTTADYVPMKWSATLEKYSQIRAAEFIIWQIHIRPNDNVCSDINGINDFNIESETCASYPGGIEGAISMWYEEKKNLYGEKIYGGGTGHYEALIDPENEYIGIGCFSTNDIYDLPDDFASAFYGTSKSISSSVNENPAGYYGECYQTIEVQKDRITLDLFGAIVKPGKQKKMRGFFETVYSSTIRPIIYPGHTITWQSSNPDIASVDQNGVVTAYKEGTTTITITDGNLSAYAYVTVSSSSTKKKKNEWWFQEPSNFSQAGKTYKVTKSKQEVSFTKTSSKSIKSITIPATVSYGGVTYKVTSIGSKAFANQKKLKKVTIGKYVKKIGSKAFYKDKKLSKVIFKGTQVKSIGKKAFSCGKKLSIKAPKKVKKKYRKLMKKAGAKIK